MRNIIIKTSTNSNIEPDEDFISFNYEKPFVALLLVINIISGVILYNWLFMG